MDDLSVRSLSSDNVSAEYEVVNVVQKEEIGLKIAGNGNEDDLRKDLEEVIGAMETSSGTAIMAKSYLDEDCVLFHGINYLGCASVNAPRSESEAIKAIRILRSQHNTPRDDSGENSVIEVLLSVPNRADGVVRLLDKTGNGELANFKVYKILFCVRGQDTELEEDCFAFTEAHEPSGFFQCHVFRCEMPEAVKKVLNSFELAFQSIPKTFSADGLLTASVENDEQPTVPVSPNSQMDRVNSVTPMAYDETLFCFNVTLEIREMDGKGNFASVPWDKASSCFKLRRNQERQVLMTVTQIANVPLTIERCFGLLLAPGRNVQHSDMHLLDMDGIIVGSSCADASQLTGQPFYISGSWDPAHSHFTLLNQETQKGTRVFISIAVDLVVQEIQEPVRLLLETKARVFPQNEKFWYYGKKLLQETFFLRLKEISDLRLAKKCYAIFSLESETNRVRRLAQVPAPKSPRYSMGHGNIGSPMLSSVSRQDEEDDNDTDEPLLSGSGEVSHDYSELVLTDWGEVLKKWKENFAHRPSGLKQLVRKGVPNALRGEVWQLLAGCHNNVEILEHYRILMSKDSPQDSVIQRDIHRTFPAHDFFKEAGGIGQESLYKISKAYSLYDREVGYCQGLSFLAAALLLHMPEEQAFGVLCKVMQEYKMRELFKNGFEALHVKFYQLERLIDDTMPDLSDHFKQLSIEAHMYSSQWFLTLFTAKFPLSMVYRVMDLFLSEGELVIFKVASSLLKCCRQELLTHDFEGVLKYFRVTLPKKYRFDVNTQQLMEAVIVAKVTSKKLKKYEKEYENAQEKLLQKDPHIVMERDNRRLVEANMRLEVENDELAEELVTAKITTETQLEKTMTHAGNLQRELTVTVGELRATRIELKEMSDENARLTEETKQAKELCRREMEKQEREILKKTTIIQDYKLITSQLSVRIEKMQNTHKDELERMKNSPTDGIVPAEQSVSDEKEMLRKQVRNLELELSQTKLSKVESECKVQELEHQLASAIKELQSSKITWLHKTITNLTLLKTKDTQGSLSSTSEDPPSHSGSGSRLPDTIYR